MGRSPLRLLSHELCCRLLCLDLFFFRVDRGLRISSLLRRLSRKLCGCLRRLEGCGAGQLQLGEQQLGALRIT